MRFTADYDSEEEEYPINDNEKDTSEIIHNDLASDEDDDLLDYIFSVQYSPRANRDAWVHLSVTERSQVTCRLRCTIETEKYIV